MGIVFHYLYLFTIHWYFVDQKFPTKSLELFLQATVHFPEVIPPVPEGVVDPFCVGLNSYAEVCGYILIVWLILLFY